MDNAGKNKLLTKEAKQKGIKIKMTAPNMPQMNGKQCVKEIKQHSEFAKIPVIIYSTSKYKKEIDEITAIGAATFLTKPALFNDLKIAIAEVIIKKLENISGGT